MRNSARMISCLREIAAITGIEINAVSGRVHELKEMGQLAERKKRPCKVTHRTITPVALAESAAVMEQAA